MLDIFLQSKNKNFEDISNMDKAIMITSLMIESAKSDDNFSDSEKNLIKKILQNKLHLSNDEIDNCFENSQKVSKNSVEIYSLTKEIRDNFSKEEVLLIFEFLWQIILSDGLVDDFEASMMTKLTGLFHLTGRESSEARNNAKASLNL